MLLVAAGFAASCGGGGASGLRCKGGDFYLGADEFTDCAQCPSSDCAFEGNVSQVCTYPNGVQHCTITSGTVTAHCGAQRATVTISDDVYSCAGSTSAGSAGA